MRAGRVLLAAIFLVSLGGRFTLDRVSAALPHADLRVIALTPLVVVATLWSAGQRRLRGAAASAEGAPLLGLVAFAGYMALTSLWAPPGARIAQDCLDLLCLVALVLLTADVAAKLRPEDRARVWTWVRVAGFLYLAIALAAGPGAQGRFAVPGGGPNVFVRVMVLAGLACAAISAQRGSLRPLLPLPLFLFGAVLSGSRGGLVAFALTVLVGSAPILRRLPRRATTAVIVSTAVLVLAADQLTNAEIVTSLRDRYVTQTFVEHYASSRGDITGGALDLWRSHVLGGSGLDGYYALIGRQSGFEYPHDLLLAAASEGGVIGVLLLVWAIAGLATRALRAIPVGRQTLFALLSAAYLFVAGLFSGDYYDSRFMWMFLVLAALDAGPGHPPRAGRRRA